MMAVWVVVVVLGVGAGAAAMLSRRHADDVEPTVREFTEFRDAIARQVAGVQTDNARHAASSRPPAGVGRRADPRRDEHRRDAIRPTGGVRLSVGSARRKGTPMPSLGPAEILVILVIALLVFGPNKMPEIARQVGKGFREFRRVQQHLKSELRDVVSEFDSPPSTADGSTERPVPMLPPKRATPPDRRSGPSAGRRPIRGHPPAERRQPLDRRGDGLSPSRRTQPTCLTRPVPFRKAARSRRPDDGLRAPRRAPPSADDLHRRGRRRRDVVFMLRPRDHQLADHVLQRRDPRGRAHKFIFTGPLDAFATRLKIATYGGIVLALPVVALAAVAVHHAGAEPEREAVRDPVHPGVDRAVRRWAAVVALLTLAAGPRVPVQHRRRPTSGPCSPPTSTSRSSSLMILAFGLSFEFPVVLVFLLHRPGAHHRAAAQLAPLGGRDHRGVRGDHHAEPGPLLAVPWRSPCTSSTRRRSSSGGC